MAGTSTYATTSVNAKRSLWKRATNDIGDMLSGSSTCKAVKSDICLDESEQELDLNEMLEQLQLLARFETRPAVLYLRQLLTNLEGCNVEQCTLNKLLLKARVQLNLEKKHTEELHFRASNSLHLSGSDLQIGKHLTFEATLVDDGILLTDVKGLSVQVTVLKGTFRCDVFQARIHSNGGQCRLQLKTRNPLIGKSADDLSQADLQADVYQNHVDEKEIKETKAKRLLERRSKERKLRKTATRMKAIDLTTLNRVAQSTLGLKSSEPDSYARFEIVKTIICIYAVSLVLVASYFYLMTKVPQLVPIAMTLSAISFLLLGCDRQWTLKFNLAVLLNVFSMTVVTICLFYLL